MTLIVFFFFPSPFLKISTEKVFPPPRDKPLSLLPSTYSTPLTNLHTKQYCNCDHVLVLEITADIFEGKDRRESKVFRPLKCKSHSIFYKEDGLLNKEGNELKGEERERGGGVYDGGAE